jgi:hypothetical protein
LQQIGASRKRHHEEGKASLKSHPEEGKPSLPDVNLFSDLQKRVIGTVWGAEVMFKSLSAKLSVALLFSAFIVPAHAVQVLTNGTFDAGITGWTSFVTANGTITDPPNPPVGPQVPQIATTASFDVTGSGASSALFLNAGGTSFTGTQQVAVSLRHFRPWAA